MRWGDVTRSVQPIVGCKVDGCVASHCGLGFCKKHYSRYKNNGDPLKTKYNFDHPAHCLIEGCERKYFAMGYCNAHYGRMRHHQKPKEHARWYKDWRKRNKNKICRDAAANAVRNAIRNGVMKKEPCVVCGSDVVEAHHASYLPDKLLTVMWLCPKHHREWHKQNRAEYPE